MRHALSEVVPALGDHIDPRPDNVRIRSHPAAGSQAMMCSTPGTDVTTSSVS
ncbi:MAG: hypothetical protein H0U94_10100 [Acidobacteria bacterium]|nr:hypothetical protein [Acidobacteriota bacterium]